MSACVYAREWLREVAVYQYCLLYSSENKRTGKPLTEMAGTSQYARAIYTRHQTCEYARYIKDGDINPYQNNVDICQHRFFCLIALAPYILAQLHSLTKENFLLAYYCSDIKIGNCFYNELFAFYLNRSTG